MQTGESRDKIDSNLEIGTRTVSGIISDFKKGLQGSDIDTGELAVERRRQGLQV